VNRLPLRFILLFVIAASVPVVWGFLYFRHYENDFRNSAWHQLSVITELKVQQISDWRRRCLGDASVLYQNDVFSGSIREFLEHPENRNNQAILEEWMKKMLDSHDEYNRICFHDRTGVERLAVPGPVMNPDSVFLKYSSEAIQSGQVIFGDLYKSTPDQRIYLNIFIPVHDFSGRSHPVLGALSIRIDPDRYLYPYIQSWPVPSQTAETLLIHRENDRVVFLNRLRFNENAALSLSFSVDKPDLPAAMVIRGIEGNVKGIDYRGVPVLASVRAIRGSPWYIVARIDKKEVYSALTTRLFILISLIAVIIFSEGLLFSLLWRRKSFQFYQEQYRSALALRESREREQILSELIERSTQPLSVGYPDGKLGICNAAFCELTGYSQEEMHKINWSETLTPPEWRNQETKWLAELEKTNRPVRYQKEYEHKSGCLIPVELLVHLVRNEEGNPQYYFAFVTDITERQKWEKALEASENKFRTLYENMEEGVALHEMIYDESGNPVDYRILDVNHAFQKHTGILAREVIGQLASTAYGISPPPYLKRFVRVAESGKSSTFETFFKPMNRYFHVSVISPGPGRFATVFEDISNRKKREDDLREKNAEMERFTYTISHDLKSPIVTIKTFLGYLEEDLASEVSGRISQDLQYLKSAADNISRLLDELLEMSRIGRVMNAPESVRYEDILDAVLRNVAGSLTMKRVDVVVLPCDVIFYADRQRLTEIWQNLIENSVKFMGSQPDPHIEVGSLKERRRLIFYVRDNGMGIDPRYHEKIFGLFDKLDKKTEGSGLGLALIKRIIEMYHGEIWVESAGAGQGVCFYFTLPKALYKNSRRNSK
jgi:PAS domain S-box-containing protein